MGTTCGSGRRRRALTRAGSLLTLQESSFERFLEADPAAAWPWERVSAERARALRLAPPATHLGQNRTRFRVLADALVGPVATGASICDVGAFPGTVLRLIRSLPGGDGVTLGAVGLGFDDRFREALSDLRVESIEAEFDVRVLPQDVPHLLSVPVAEDRRWDVVLCTEVIEHQLQPLSLLLGCHRLLRPGGTLILTTNSASFIGDVLKLLAGRHNVEPLERSHVLVDHEWRPHIRLYLLEELQQLLDMTGFRVVEGRCFDNGSVYSGSKGAAIGAIRRVASIVPRLRSHVFIEAIAERDPGSAALRRVTESFAAFGLEAQIRPGIATARSA